MIEDDPGAKLSVTISNGMTVEVRLGRKEVKIGRGHEADLQLPDPSVSRIHAKVFRVGSQYFLADLRSRNGTHAGGKRISQLSLDDGRMFQVGPFRIHFHCPVHGFPAGEEPTAPSGAASAIAGAVDADPVRVPPKGTESATALGEAPFGLIGGSAHVRKLVATIRRVAASDVPVLIEGETGSGKELVARGIHDASARRERPFIVVNCGAISPELIESELFGHEKGAFTGATTQRKGAFELANSGTIFLDEIGELPITLQPKLLRALEQKEFKRVGGNELSLADVRILAATNRNLREEVARKMFREDLYFRIGAIMLSIPPLRDRREDVAPIARHFLSRMGNPASGTLFSLSPAALDALIAHDWPGNVREVRNAIQRAAVMADSGELTAHDFSFLRQGSAQESETENPSGLSRWELAERTNILGELARQMGNKTKAARELGIAKSTLFEKLKKYGIRTAEFDR
jgi:DNA-binding NtrC family response regulator